MTTQPTTGPALLDIRWGQTTTQLPDGRVARELYPHTEHQETEGYLHPGIAAAAVLGAIEKTVGSASPATSAGIAFDAPVPLGMDLRVLVDEETNDVEIEVHERADIEQEARRTVVRGTVGSGSAAEPPNAGALRAAAIAPVPEGQEHTLHAGCYVCGQDNPNGLQLLPGWAAPDTVVTAFLTPDSMVEGGTVPAPMIATLLSCPTLWAGRDHLDEVDAGGALTTTYEVQFLEEVPAAASLRTVGIAGAHGDDTLRGSSALVAEDGTIHATATATWALLDEAPTREPGRPDPASAQTPLKGGRPEGRSSGDWGQPLPGRRETTGPRSERAGDHDRRPHMGIAVERDDPREPRRSVREDD